MCVCGVIECVYVPPTALIGPACSNRSALDSQNCRALDLPNCCAASRTSKGTQVLSLLALAAVYLLYLEQLARIATAPPLLLKMNFVALVELFVASLASEGVGCHAPGEGGEALLFLEWCLVAIF